MKHQGKTMLLCILLFLALSFSQLQPVIAQPPQSNLTRSSSQDTVTDKIDSLLLQALNTKGSSDFVVEIAEKANLEAAYSMDWEARGEYAYRTLRETAERTQKPVVAYLDQHGIKYQSFFAANEVMVFGSDLIAVQSLAALNAVAYIRAPKTVYLHPPALFSQEMGPQKQLPKAALSWGLNDVHAPEFWSAFGLQGSGIIVANIDTGVQWNHPALAQSYKCGTNPSDPACWYDPANICGGSACDNIGHGTHTMGTMVGDDDPDLLYTVGMAPEAKWIACKGCESNSCSDFALNSCADWIVAPNGNPANRPHIVNNSWGGGGGNTWYLPKVNAWRAAGIFPAFSAGNMGSGCNSLGSPGDYQESFASAAHDVTREAASFSSRGPSAFGHDPYTKPNISAPGVDICSAVPGNGWDCSYSGTSMASPHAAGAVALLWSCNPGLIGQMNQTFELLQNTSDTPGTGNCGAPPDGEGNYTYGYGYLNVLAAGYMACRTGTLTGTVSDGSVGIAEAIVTADNGAGIVVNTRSGTDGSYILNLPEDTYTVSATRYGYTTDIVSGVVILEGETTVRNFLIAPVPMAVVSGIVTDGGVAAGMAHGYPLYARIHIQAPGLDRVIFTDPFTGAYETILAQNTNHTFTVEALVGGYEPLSATVMPNSDPFTRNFSLMVSVADCAAPGYTPVYDILFDFESGEQGFSTEGITSFTWGTPTSGPMSSHSGQYVWATNLAGNYGSNEDGYLVSPPLDLTGYGTNRVVVDWWQWMQTENWYDFGSIEVTRDGGSTWELVWGQVSGDIDLVWSKHQLMLDPAFNVADFQIRFHLTSDFIFEYPGWYIDDIGIYGFTPPAEVVLYSQDFETGGGGFTHSGVNDEWEWGVPAMFPNACADGSAGCWDIDLDGNYENSADQSLFSPVIDLSGVTLPPDTPLLVQWKQSISIQHWLYDRAFVEFSTDGISWTPLWMHMGVTIMQGWTLMEGDVSIAAGGNLYLRWRLVSDGSITYEGFSVDDIRVFYQPPYSIEPVECSLVPGGVLAGYVFDDNLGSKLIGAEVASVNASGTTFEVSGDPVHSGIFWLFQPTNASPAMVEFTASMDKYGAVTDTVQVNQDAVNSHDFHLPAGWLSFVPPILETTMTMGDPAKTILWDIQNGGGVDVTFELREKPLGHVPLQVSIPRFTGQVPKGAALPSTGRAPDTKPVDSIRTAEWLQAKLGEPAYATNVYPGQDLVYFLAQSPVIFDRTIPISLAGAFAGDFLNGEFSTLYVADFTSNELYAVDTTTGVATLIGPLAGMTGNITGLTGSVDGVLYLSTADDFCSSSNLYTVDPATGITSLIGTVTNGGCLIDIAINADGQMYGVDIVADVLVSIDPSNAQGTVIGPLGVDANFAQGLDFEEESGVLYWAAFNNMMGQGELRVIDPLTGASELIGVFPDGAEIDCLAFETGGVLDVPWLSEDPAAGIVPAGGNQGITITFDPTLAGLPQPGDYLAVLRVKHDTPYAYSNVPVTLHLLPPPTWGTLKGILTGLGFCDEPLLPIQGGGGSLFQVAILDQLGNLVASLKVDVNGYYSWSLVAGTYDLVFSAPGYVSQRVEDVVLAAGATVVNDAMMHLALPCIQFVQNRIEETMLPWEQRSVMVDVVNTGYAGTNFTIWEYIEGDYLEEHILDGSFEMGTSPVYSPWEQFSTNFGSPLCSIFTCRPVGSGPHFGEWWAWFGGTLRPEESYVSQMVVIPTGRNVQLSFWLEIPMCSGSAGDFLRVEVDGEPLMTVDGTNAQCGVIGYQQHTFNLTDYADDNLHTIRFYSNVAAGSSFLVDDVSVFSAPDVPWLSVSPDTGYLSVGSSQEVAVNLRTAGMLPATYEAMLLLGFPLGKGGGGAGNFSLPVALQVREGYVSFLPLIRR